MWNKNLPAESCQVICIFVAADGAPLALNLLLQLTWTAAAPRQHPPYAPACTPAPTTANAPPANVQRLGAADSAKHRKAILAIPVWQLSATCRVHSVSK
jgi:hypothetical protein